MTTCLCGHKWEEHFPKADRRYCMKCSCGHFITDHGEDCSCAYCKLTHLKAIKKALQSTLK